MSKSSISNGDIDKTVRSDISCGSYVSADYKVALPKYLVHLPSYSDFIMDMDVEEELNDRLNGVYLGGGCDNTRDFYDTMWEVESES